jgi:branched-chain amino acid aminotransferase
MDEPIGRYYICNDSLSAIESLGDVARLLGDSVYEVIRVEKKTPLFIEDHIARLNRSAGLFGNKEIFHLKKIRKLVAILISKSDFSSGNIKIAYGETKGKSKKILLIYFIKSRYPKSDMYKNGVRIGVLRGERESPDIKQSDTPVRKKADAVLTEGRYYEVILENKAGYITEGSRTNIFLIKDDILYTPPTRDVLSGITRQKVIEISKRNSIPLFEKSIARSDLSKFDTLFLTGTSAKLLPIRHVEDISFAVDHLLLRHLMKLYDESIASYIEDFSVSHRAVSN